MQAVLAAVPLLGLAPAQAAPEVAGRWEGVAEIPGAPQRVVVDLAPDAQGRWVGSVVLPGRGVKGAALEDLAVTADSVSFGLRAAMPFPIDPVPRVTLARRVDGSLVGALLLGGQRAALTLQRRGEPQVDHPARSVAISAQLEGVWRGRYELGGVAREVTMTLSNRAGAPAGGQLVIVGKRQTTLTVDEIVQGTSFVMLRAGSADFRIEGRFDAAGGTIDGAMTQGPFEAPIVLRRQRAVAPEKAS